MKIIEKIKEDIFSSKRSNNEQTFIVFSLVTTIACILTIIGDILYKDNLVETVIFIEIAAFFPIVSFLTVHLHSVEIGKKITVVCLIFFIIPAIVILRGGVNGGGAVWIIFAYLYIGIVMTGVWRRVSIVVLSLLTVALYAASYFYPEIIIYHSKKVEIYDTCFSTITVGLLTFCLVWYQVRLLRRETECANEQTKKAEELNHSQNRFFSSMSHEIRTPINTVLGLNEIILRQEDASEEIIKDAKNIQGAGRMLLSLINDLLDFSKIEAGRMDIVPINYKVEEMISEIVSMVWLKAQEKGLLFTVNIDPGVPSELYGDEVRIKQILINILNNAVKYTSKGSVSLHIECEALNENEVILNISVSDTGMGIKQEMIPYLFDAFSRFDKEKNRHIEGTGLGLSIVKQLTDLMGGTITVNSVYGQGSTFSISLKQRIVSLEPIGNINIENSFNVTAVKYENSFTAPDVSILIVDDNEMNLQVEEKLLDGTGMSIDLSLDGNDALTKTIEKKYDLIFMDHLMPEMDGIVCLENIRRQTGGLNKDTPIIVLTANAGSDNKELYKKSGFDGYLIKPVSGKQLEQCLINNLPAEKVILSGSEEQTGETIDTAKGYIRKKPILITTSSMCDLPETVLSDLQVEQLPFTIRTRTGVFFDGIETVSDEMIYYINTTGEMVKTEPPVVADFTEFFSRKLLSAQYVIYIAISSSISVEYERAVEAAKTFDNVIVIDSQLLSSAVGMLVLIACRLAALNYPVEKLVDELLDVRKQINCGFIISDVNFLKKKGFLNPAISQFMTAMEISPSLRMSNNQLVVDRLFMGTMENCFNKFISREFSSRVRPDNGLLFITYADIPEDMLLIIEEKVHERFAFDTVIFQKMSAGGSSNCGPGTFGLSYLYNINTKYNLENFFSFEGKLIKARPKRNASAVSAKATSLEQEEIKREAKWYENIEGINPEAAIKNSGSEKTLKSVLKVFYESIPVKFSEIKEYYENEDWENYTIKVHALKSSARLVGALDIGDRAQELEYAGKENNIELIREKTEPLLSDYEKYREILAPLFEESNEDGQSKDKPVADMTIMESVYEMIGEAAKAMDADSIADAFKEIEDYSVPESEREKFEALKEKYDNYDYEGIEELLK